MCLKSHVIVGSLPLSLSVEIVTYESPSVSINIHNTVIYQVIPGTLALNSGQVSGMTQIEVSANNQNRRKAQKTSILDPRFGNALAGISGLSCLSRSSEIPNRTEEEEK